MQGPQTGVYVPVFVHTLHTTMSAHASGSSGTVSRYAFRNITQTRFSWTLCRTRLTAVDLRDLRSYRTSPITPEPSGNNENVHTAYDSRRVSILAHYCADCTTPAKYRRIKLKQLSTLTLPRCYTCNHVITIPDSVITGITPGSRYEAAFNYLISRQQLRLTYQSFIEGRRRASQGR